MAKGEIEREFDVPIEKLFSVIVKYEEYPEFVDGVNRVEVERISEREAKCTYKISIVKDLTYVLKIVNDPAAGTINWTLLESDIFKKNDGGWKLKKIDNNTTHVDYFVDAEFKVPVPGFILKKLVKSSLPSMMDAFEERTQAID